MERVLSGPFLSRPGVPHLPDSESLPGHRRAPPTLGPRGCGYHLIPEGLRLPPGPRGPWPRRTPRPSPLGPDRWAPASWPSWRPCPAARSLQARAACAARPDRRAAHRVRLQALARLDGRCQRHRRPAATLPAGGFSMKAIPGRRFATASGPGAGTRAPPAARRAPPPPPLSTRAAPRAAAAARRSPRPSADLPPPPCCRHRQPFRAATSRGVLGPNRRSHSCPDLRLQAPRSRTASSVLSALLLRPQDSSP